MVHFSCFMGMTFSKPPNQNDVEPCIRFLINNGVPTDDIKCFDQHSHLKKKKKMHENLHQLRIYKIAIIYCFFSLLLKYVF
jgi:hypothetical protein